MIDLKRLRDDDDYRQGTLRKGASAETVDALLAAEESRRSVLTDVEKLRAESNAASKAIGRAEPDERQAKIEQASALKRSLGALEVELGTISDTVNELVLQVPNPADASVPDGGEENFRVERVVGEPGPVPAMNHAELMESLGVIDTERAVRMSGSRFAYLLGDAVRLQFGLIQWALAKLADHGFVPVVTPVLVREEMMELAGFFPTDKNQVYAIPEDDLYLIGTAEVGLAGLHRGERLAADDMPVRYAGYSSCFRREAGTYGKDTQGLFRVHQFDKVEMFSYTTADKSWEELELICSLQEEIVTELGLPYRLITVAAGDLGAPAAKKYDIEVWLPSEQRYRELTSCSNYLDYSARRMGTRVKTDNGTELAHTLNGTACAIGRTLLFLFENHLQDDGSVVVPEALRSYVGGLERIVPKD